MDQGRTKQGRVEETSSGSGAEDGASVEALARRFRHVGYTIFGLLAFLTGVFLLFQIVSALSEGNVLDPYTGEPLELSGSPFGVRELTPKSFDID